jgi:arabinogalactan oligomer / maltooligosaccharide transport system permease protein
VLAFAPLLYQIAMALTDFSTASIRDGIRGGVLREALQGLMGWLPASEPFANRDGKVHYVGAALLARTFGAADGLIGFTLGFSVLWTAVSVTTQTLLGVGVALLLNKPGVKLAALWRALFIIPWAIPEFVGGIAWRTLVDERAGVLALLNRAPVDWRQDSLLSFVVLLLAGTWAGFPIIMLAAGTALKMIPPGAADAAAVDGAGRWATLRWITAPLMLPVLMPALIIRAISAFNQLYLFYAMFAPAGTLATASYFLFTPLGGVFGSSGGLYAVSAALNLFIIVVLIIFMLRFNRASKAMEGVTYA